MISNLINNLNTPALSRTAFIGLDGFVDEIIHVVDKRFSAKSYERIKTIADYAARINRASAMSTNIELVNLKTKMGGNGTILASVLLNYATEVIYMGSIGYPTLDPIMAPLLRCKRLIPLSPPAHTDALEFEDGKIITSKLTAFDQVTWERIQNCLPLTELVALFQQSDLIAFSNWSMIVNMNEIWKQFSKTIMPLMDCRGKIFFFDLADPEKRTREDLMQALSLIKSFTHPGFRVILSLNLKEAYEVAGVLEMNTTHYQAVNLDKSFASALQNRLNIDCVVIHPPEKAVCIHQNGFEEVCGPYCRNPVITTGAGDHFNAGFLYGILQGFPIKECLILGCATSGYYVRYADSPTQTEISLFLSAWDENRLDA